MLPGSHTLPGLSGGRPKGVWGAGMEVLSGSWLHLHRSPFPESCGHVCGRRGTPTRLGSSQATRKEPSPCIVEL